MEHVVSIENLSRRYRRTLALDQVSLTLEPGTVLGLVGGNGAGKTTLIKHILGLLHAQEGSVRIFGQDPVTNPVDVLSRVGYLSENRDLPGWMRVQDLVKYMKALYPGWDDAYAEELRQIFGLDPTAKIRTLSLGQTAKAGLLAAIAHRPDLLVLDEPSSGLDPVVRRDILGAILRTVAHEGRTVLFSSHLLHEIESAADRVVMVHGGRIVFDTPTDALLRDHCRIVIAAREGMEDEPEFPGALAAHREGARWMVVCHGNTDALRNAAVEHGYDVTDIAKPTLDEIFVARVGLPLSMEKDEVR